MKPRCLTALAVLPFTLCAALSAQLPTGHYLVGTYGWDDQWAPDPTKSTVQVFDPFASTATLLDVTGLPSNEYPSTFLVEDSRSFLMSTKDWNSPPQNGIYRVRLVGGTWQATQLHPQKLPINTNGMAQVGRYVYVVGSGVFGTGGDDAQIWRVPRHGGDAVLHAGYGIAFQANGALGVGSGLVAVGDTLHAFTFDSTQNGPPNEHWAIETVPFWHWHGTFTPSMQRVGQLPASLRRPGYGYATSAATYDPSLDLIVAASRYGELAWLDPVTGATLRQAALPGAFSTAPMSEYFGGVVYNEDTGALGMGDFDVGVDEYRCNGGPFATDLVAGVRPVTPGAMAILGITYVPTRSSYLPVGDGCPGSAGLVGSSYLGDMPSRHSCVEFTLTADASAAVLLIGWRDHVDLTGLGAPGCILAVDPWISIPVTLNAGFGTASLQLPPFPFVLLWTQWTITDPSNPLGYVLSDARRLWVR